LPDTRALTGGGRGRGAGIRGWHGAGLVLTGTQTLHVELERRLATWLGCEAAPFHPSCSAGNMSLFAAIAQALGQLRVHATSSTTRASSMGCAGGVPSSPMRACACIRIVTVTRVASFDEALAEANAPAYGLTAGVFSEDQAELDRFLDEIQAGVIYVNRRAGATTGAWPGTQTFCGWKSSGSTGKGGLGPYYLAQFMREQSRTVVG
jgi:hypothetical protein